MSFVSATPDRLVTAARNLAGIGSTLHISNATAAAPTLAVSAAASDQVSAAVAAFFSGHARGYQTVSAQAEKFHTEFVQKLSAGADTYSSAESANASPLQPVLNPVSDALAGTGAAATKTAATPNTSQYRGGNSRGSGTANPRAGAALRPEGGGGTEGVRGGSSTEAVMAGGNCGSGGLLLRTGVLGAAVGGWSGGVARTGGAGGLLNRLLEDRTDSFGAASGRTAGATSNLVGPCGDGWTIRTRCTAGSLWTGVAARNGGSGGLSSGAPGR
ncbi:PE family protein [Mycobacterium sp. ML4]